MIFDLSDPIGTVQLIGSILVLYELVKILDSDDTGEHIQDRIEFYRGIIGKVGDGLGKIGSGFQIIFNRIFPTNKQLHDKIAKDMDEVLFQMEEEPEEEHEGVIEG